MSRLVNAEYPQSHAGVARFERGLGSLAQTARGMASARGAATMLLAAIVSALLVVANELVETWTEGHLLAAWVVLWAVGFAAIALLAEPASKLAAELKAGLKARAVARKQEVADERLWEAALTDARVMADVSRAMSQTATERDLKAYY